MALTQTLAHTLLQDGPSQYYSAQVLSVTFSAIQKAVVHFIKTGTYGRRPGTSIKSKFCLRTPDGQKRIWRTLIECFDPCNIV